jgi:general secretion pathway protein D
MRQTTLSRFTVLLLAATIAAAQEPSVPANPAPNQSSSPATTVHPQVPAAVSTKDARRAAKLFLSAAKLYEAGQFEPALAQYQQAAALDPGNNDYAIAVEVARSHAVTALIQSAAKARVQSNPAAARAALARALELDPKNVAVAEHLSQLADDTVAQAPPDRASTRSFALAPPFELAPTTGPQSFHLHTGPQQLIQQVYKAYGITATLDSSVSGPTTRFDIDDAPYAQAVNALSLATNTFAVPIDSHRVLVARSTPQMHAQFDRNAVESVSLAGLSSGASSGGSSNEMNDIQAIAKNVYEIQRMNLDAGASTLTMQASPATLSAFNNTWNDLSEGRAEVVIDVRILSIAHTNARNTGLQTPQQIGVFNVLSEANSILQANQALVQQIIASGLAGPNDIATILAILIASGAVTSPLFNNGFAIFGGNCSLSSGTCSPGAFALVPGTTTFNFNVNSSDSRLLDNYQFRLMDGEEGTLKSGTQYPITTSSYSNLASSLINIPGVNTAGNSGVLSGITSALGNTATIPQIQYQDLGLTLKTTPHVLRSGNIALSVDLKILSLAGGMINGIPVLNNTAYSGMATMQVGEAAVVAGEIDVSQVHAISGIPGVSEIPGVNNITNTNVQKSTATLLIVMTPHLVRLPHGKDGTPMQTLERKAQAR